MKKKQNSPNLFTRKLQYIEHWDWWDVPKTFIIITIIIIIIKIIVIIIIIIIIIIREWISWT